MRKRHLILCCLIVLAMVRPAAAQNIDPALKADITRLIDLLNATQNLEELSGVVADAMVTSMRSAHPDAPPRVLTVVNEIVKKNFSDALGGRDGLLSRVVPIYAKYYTREDIQGLIAFYQSDVGRKAIMTMPAVFQESMTIGQQWASETLPQIQREVEQQLRAEGIQ
jgi:hypothetical protein